ncbi:hypothetical protein LX64_03469 [Chitinophaga skermanii]|uniref:Uncharacterized protein n=1 Tax=Chitinophaga skermanii TaxID=331697 RepID=A0A327QDQ9_9BACT|nr:hypothetical protein [Chitinophaga skermanii]RAJ02451.1 hypothetical protein LX64_03469 [Chitinophaga skermanii]
MEWVSIKPVYKDGRLKPSREQLVYSRLTKAGFYLEQMHRDNTLDTVESFYFHPSRYIQVHEVCAAGQGIANFYLFLPGGSTAYASGVNELEVKLQQLGL